MLHSCASKEMRTNASAAAAAAAAVLEATAAAESSISSIDCDDSSNSSLDSLESNGSGSGGESARSPPPPAPPPTSSITITKTSATNTEDYFFEGAEKRLCVFLRSGAIISANGAQIENDDADLRRVSREQWSDLLASVKCRILSTISINGGSITAFLLSESSMFVARDHVMIKTCGNTQLLNCLHRIGRLARTLGFCGIAAVRYSRKNLLAPQLQDPLYRHFESEVRYMQQVLQQDGIVKIFGGGGSGKSNLSAISIHNDNNNDNADESSHDRFHFFSSPSSSSSAKQVDQKQQQLELYKLEVIMEKLDPSVMEIFMSHDQDHGNQNSSAAAAAAHRQKLAAREATRRSGIGQLLPDMILIDDHIFDPCGYSMNGLVGRRGHYITVHVTPESSFSYVSLETNVPQRDYPRFVAKILTLFRPRKFMLNLIVPSPTLPALPLLSAANSSDSIPLIVNQHHTRQDIVASFALAQFHGYARAELQRASIDANCEMIYARYVAPMQ